MRKFHHRCLGSKYASELVCCYWYLHYGSASLLRYEKRIEENMGYAGLYILAGERQISPEPSHLRRTNLPEI